MDILNKEKEIEEIILAYLLTVRKLEKELGSLIQSQLKRLVARVLLKVNQNLKYKEKSRCNEGLYYVHERIAQCYKAYSGYGEMAIDNLTNPIMRERLYFIKGRLEDRQEKLVIEEDNPIAYERMLMISGGIGRMKQLLEPVTEVLEGQYNIDNHITVEALIHVMKAHMQDFFKAHLPAMMDLLKESILLLDIREEAHGYERLIEIEKQVIEPIILEIEVMERSLEIGTERQIVRDLLSTLVVAKEAIVAQEKRIEESQRISFQPTTILDQTMIQEIIDHQEEDYIKEAEDILTSIEINYEESLAKLEAMVLEELTRNSNETLKNVREVSQSYYKLSQQVVLLFQETVTQLEALHINYQTEEGKKIGEGIFTTMKLKCEGLKNKDALYQNQKADKVAEQETELMGIRIKFEQEIKTIMDQTIDGIDEGLITLQTTFNKTASQIQASQLKVDRTYLREELLFELRTFEEMVHLSLRKIVGYEGEHILNFVTVMERLYGQLRKVLSDQGIRFIEPDPHEEFDGKIHEIIVAKEEASFKRGEVIRCQNIGYVEGAYVVLRAMVVVAK